MKRSVYLLLCCVLLLAVIPASSFSAETVPKRPSYLFAIDAGHGGNDSGAIGVDGRYERNDTAKIANEVIRLLQEQGQRTMLINRNLKTDQRPNEANQAKADFLISLHRDSSKSSSARGISVYTHEPSHRQRTEQPTKDYAPAEYANKHAVDEKLVNNLKTYLTGATGLSFRGVYYGSASAPTWEDYYINRLSNMPSCIIEYGFVSNAADNKIFDEQYKTLALATVKALLNTVDLSYVGPFTGSGAAINQSGSEWYYTVNGVVQWDYTGTVTVNQKSYYIENGLVYNCSVYGHRYDFVCDPTCNICGEKREVTHTYSAACDPSCNICGEIREAAPHTYSADCDAVCNVCGAVRKTEVQHIFNDEDICTVCGSRKYIVGDLDGDLLVTDADAVYLLMHTFFEEDYPVNQPCDYNHDSIVTDEDAVYLLMHTFFEEDYPI